MYVAGPKRTRNDCKDGYVKMLKNLMIIYWILLNGYLIIPPWYILHLLAPVVLCLGFLTIVLHFTYKGPNGP